MRGSQRSSTISKRKAVHGALMEGEIGTRISVEMATDDRVAQRLAFQINIVHGCTDSSLKR